jgi:pentatricopeptide repeat protein
LQVFLTIMLKGFLKYNKFEKALLQHADTND